MCSLEYDLTLKTTSRRYRNNIDVPEGVSIEDAMKIYNQGWGHATAKALHYFTEHVDVIPEYGSDFQSDEFIEWMNKKIKRSGVHIVKK